MIRTPSAIGSTSHLAGMACVRAVAGSHGMTTPTAITCCAGGLQAALSARLKYGATCAYAQHWRGTAGRWWRLWRSRMQWRWWQPASRHAQPTPHAGCTSARATIWPIADKPRNGCRPGLIAQFTHTTTLYSGGNRGHPHLGILDPCQPVRRASAITSRSLASRGRSGTIMAGSVAGRGNASAMPCCNAMHSSASYAEHSPCQADAKSITSSR